MSKLYLKIIGVHFEILQDESSKNLSYQLRYRRYCLDRDFEDPKDFSNGLETDHYDAYSMHFGAYNRHGSMLATSRIIKNSDLGFQIEKVINIGSKKDSAEVSRLTVSHNIQGIKRKMILIGLIYFMYNFCKRNNILYWYALVDIELLKKLKRLFFFQYKLLGSPVLYHGALRVPIRINI